MRVGAGVPQRSILGPVLYTLYVSNFLRDRFTRQQYLGCYADDTAIATRSLKADLRYVPCRLCKVLVKLTKLF
ncbi:hypothetical protein X975_08935, partial [Stegodyphus mimosarum]